MAPGRFGSGTLVAGGCEEFQGNHKLVGGLEHGFYDFPYIGNSDPN